MNTTANSPSPRERRRIRAGQPTAIPANKTHRVDAHQLAAGQGVTYTPVMVKSEAQEEQELGATGLLVVAILLALSAIGVGFIVGRYFS